MAPPTPPRMARELAGVEGPNASRWRFKGGLCDRYTLGVQVPSDYGKG
jgi:hypothetical protein